MKANELRIGNWVLSKDMPVQIEEIKPETIRYCFGEFPISYIEPINLTEEWLVKFGFKVGNHKQFNKWINEYENSSLFVDDNYYGIAINGIDVWTISRKLYVHQLQNLYFALTGEELEIK